MQNEPLNNSRPMNASEARSLSNQQLAKQRDEESTQRQKDAEIAKQLSDRVLSKIEKRAQAGATDAVCIVWDIFVRAADREDVYQQVVRHIDKLGYNVLYTRESMWIGQRAIFKVEW